MIESARRHEPGPGYGRLFEALEAELSAFDPERREHYRRFVELGFPTTRVEAWKYTDLRAVAQAEPLAPQAERVSRADLAAHLLGGDARHLVFVNGTFAPELSAVELAPGVTLRRLSEVAGDGSGVRTDADGDHPMAALNAALVRDGAVLTVEPGVAVGPTIQLLFVDTGAPSALITLRNRIDVGAGAVLRLAETHVTLGDGGITTVVTHMTVGDGGDLEVDKVVLGGTGTRFFAVTRMQLGKRAKLGQTTAVAGGALVRNETLARLVGSHADLDLNGVYVPVAGEHVDTVIRVEHLAPNCESNQFYKGILAEGGHGVFAGKIYVDQVAQKTNAYQQNDNLMLSRDAEIDTKPELEIYADDVKCSHGATVGELDDTGLFYLRSRGIGRQTAEAILTFAFAGEVVERFVHEDSQHMVRRALLGRVRGGNELMELV